jgi:hypothetical protein
MAPDEIAVLAAVVLFAVGGFALVHFAKKHANNQKDNKK